MNCSKCGHSQEAHGTRSGYCHEQVGQLECKCGGFANNPPIKNPEQFAGTEGTKDY